MSVLDKDKIDAIALERDKQGLILLISDHLDWLNEYKHLLILQDKINSYITFLEEKQYERMEKFRNVSYAVIEIHFLVAPTENCIRFLQRIQDQVGEMGIRIQCSINEEN